LLKTRMAKRKDEFTLIFPMHLNFQQDMRYYTLIYAEP